MLYSAAIGTADFKGLSLRLEKRYSAGLFFLANYQLSENRDNGSGEVEANDTAFRTDFDADESLSRYHQRHRGAFSFGYELPFGDGRRWLNSGGARRVRPRRVAGAGRHPRRQRIPVHVVRHERLPVRLVRAPARQLCCRAVKATAERSTIRRWRSGTTRRPTCCPQSGFQGTAGRNTLIGPGSKQVDFSTQQALPARRVASRVPLGDLQSVQHDELRTAGRQHQQRHRRGHLHRG